MRVRLVYRVELLCRRDGGLSVHAVDDTEAERRPAEDLQEKASQSIGLLLVPPCSKSEQIELGLG